MKITVIGGAGYVGSVLCPILCKDERVTEVKVVDTFWFWDSPSSYKEYFSAEEREKLTIEAIDIREDLNDVLKNQDVVINLACISNDICSDLDPDFTHDVSYNGVMNVIKTCERLGVKRIIQASSGSVYGVQEKPVSEETQPVPITQYAVIKMEIDHYLEYLMKSGDHDITILRLATLYGPSPRQRIDLMVNIFADKVAKGEPIVVHGGKQSRPALHVKDLSLLIQSILEDDRSYGEIFNVSKEEMTVLEYANMFKELYPDLEIIVEDVVDQRSWRTNSEKLYRDLGIINRASLKSSIKELVEKFSDPNFSHNRTVNMKVMKDILYK